MSPPKRCRILCAGIVVLDKLFRVKDFPPPDGKVKASAYVAIGGGNAANEAITSRGLAATRATQRLSAGLKCTRSGGSPTIPVREARGLPQKDLVIFSMQAAF